MAYSKINYYRRIIDIQNIVLKQKELDPSITQKEIYYNNIYPVYKISIRTYTTYLSINAKAKIKQLQKNTEADDNSNNQLKLF
jgi:hypothetical protein